METFKEIIEIIYYLCAPALLFAALYGLRQLSISSEQIKETKEARRISAKRESYQIAAEQCKYFGETILPVINKLDKTTKENNLEFFNKSIVTINKDEIKVVPYKEKQAVEKIFEFCVEDLMLLNNYIENFSIYFSEGIADERIGFNTVGKIYVDSVKKYLPAFPQDDKYSYIINLFLVWYHRIENESLTKEKLKLEEKLTQHKKQTFTTVGTI